MHIDAGVLGVVRGQHLLHDPDERLLIGGGVRRLGVEDDRRAGIGRGGRRATALDRPTCPPRAPGQSPRPHQPRAGHACEESPPPDAAHAHLPITTATRFSPPPKNPSSGWSPFAPMSRRGWPGQVVGGVWLGERRPWWLGTFGCRWGVAVWSACRASGRRWAIWLRDRRRPHPDAGGTVALPAGRKNSPRRTPPPAARGYARYRRPMVRCRPSLPAPPGSR